MKDISGETLDQYLAVANKKYGDDLTMEEIRGIFDVAIKDFKDDKLYLELFGHVCDYLWTKAHTKTMTDSKMEDYVQMLYWIAEIDYYMRSLENEISERTVIDTLKLIHNYKHSE